MTLTKEQAEKIKEHLLKQLGNFPEEKRGQIEGQVKSMTTEQVENFVEENKLNHLDENHCIFCGIIEGKTPSFKIAEDEKNIAILEINPLSKGHTLIVPKKHDEKIYGHTKEFAEKVSKRINERFSPNEVKIQEINIMDHGVLEIIPLYGNETEKKSATPGELKSVQDEIIRPEPEKTKEEKIEEKPVEKIEEKPKEELPKLKARIPR
jgi:histidine triad (HIT) family protein